MPDKKSLEELQREQVELENRRLRDAIALQQLQMEDLSEQLEMRKAKKSEKMRQHSEQEKTLAAIRREEINRVRGCTHRKGGKGPDLKNNHGNDPNYSIWIHQYPMGDVQVMCTRCWSIWKPGDTAKTHPTGIGYKTAINWPTDNSPSGAVQFRIPAQRIPEDTQELQEAEG